MYVHAYTHTLVHAAFSEIHDKVSKSDNNLRIVDTITARAITYAYSASYMKRGLSEIGCHINGQSKSSLLKGTNSNVHVHIDELKVRARRRQIKMFLFQASEFSFSFFVSRTSLFER